MVSFGFSGLKAQSGNSKIVDSLRLALTEVKHDTTRCQILSNLIEFETEIPVWTKYNKELKTICLRYLGATNASSLEPIFKKYFAYVLNNDGIISYNSGNISKAIEFYSQSLKLKEEIGDKNGVATALVNIGAAYFAQSNIQKAIEYYEQGLKTFEAISDTGGISAALHNLGLMYHKDGSISKALAYYFKSLNLREKLGDKAAIATSLNNIGGVYDDIGNIPAAIEYYTKSLKIKEDIGNKDGVATSLMNLGGIYLEQGDAGKAFELYGRCLQLYESAGNRKGVGRALNKIGAMYDKYGDPTIIPKENALKKGSEKSRQCYKQSLQIFTQIDDKEGIGTSFNNIGTSYANSGDLSKALEYYLKSLEIRQKYSGTNEIIYSLKNVGNAYFIKGNYPMALEYCSKAMKYCLEIGYPEKTRGVSLLLYKIHKAANNPKLALQNYELFVKMNDSLNNQTNRKAAIRSQLKYEYEKQAAADSVAHAKESEIKNVELAKQKAEIRAKKNQQYALFGGLGLVLIFAGFMYNRFRVTQKQKRIIEHQKTEVEEQKHLVEEKQKEILDSIHYARRIQLAQIPTDKRVESMIKKVKSK